MPCRFNDAHECWKRACLWPGVRTSEATGLGFKTAWVFRFSGCETYPSGIWSYLESSRFYRTKYGACPVVAGRRHEP